MKPDTKRYERVTADYSRYRPRYPDVLLTHLAGRIDAVERGVHAAGGLPVRFPTISLGEVFLDPTSMLYRNLMSMDVEEMVRVRRYLTEIAEWVDEARTLLPICERTSTTK